MAEKERAEITAIPIDDRPEVHQSGRGSNTPTPVSAEQDKDLREGNLPEDRFDDERMKDLKRQS